MLEPFLFFYKFLQSPTQVGSIAPSSRALAKKMTDPIKWDQIGTIVELGAGTGVFTRLIHEKKPDESTFLVFEKDRVMRQRLERQFPQVRCYEDACQLSAVVSRLDAGGVDCIVSGLPFANFPQNLRDQIIGEVYESLQPGGMFITFQYSLQMKRQLEMTFAHVEIQLALLNLPPAFVYICKKREAK